MFNAGDSRTLICREKSATFVTSRGRVYAFADACASANAEMSISAFLDRSANQRIRAPDETHVRHVRDEFASDSPNIPGRNKYIAPHPSRPTRESLPNSHAAIDHNIHARHVGTLVRRQEQREVRHFLRPAETSEQRLA